MPDVKAKNQHELRKHHQGLKKRTAPPPPSAVAIAVSEINVGHRLRALRAERGWSIRELAEKSGLAMNTLSLIQNAKTSPSVSTLQQIARALEVPITAFFETGAPKTSVVHIKASRRTRVAFAHGALEDLGAGLTSRAVQPFVVMLEPHAGSGPNPIVHTGYEFVYCLQGRLTYTIQDRTYLLESGDSLLFESHLPHHWHNIEAEPSQTLLVLFPLDTRDHPTERHFAPKTKQ
jgi:transcriptional regulator with XRE-family HTH domain